MQATWSEVSGWTGDTLKVNLSAHSAEGETNEDLCLFLSELLGLPQQAVKVVTGDTSPLKQIEIRGKSLADLHSLWP